MKGFENVLVTAIILALAGAVRLGIAGWRKLASLR